LVVPGEKYNVNVRSNKTLPRWLPFVVGFALVVQFAGLGAWQVTRGLEKRAERDLFADDAGHANWSDGMAVRPYQRLKVRGEFDLQHQVLLDNIILNSRYGYYVVTPLSVGDNIPVLLVNRGWKEKTGDAVDQTSLAVDTAVLQVRGRAGSLPKAGYKMGDAFSPGSPWPKHAVYPTIEDIAAQLGRDVQPFVLLMEPGDELGFVRHWIPEEMGPGRHFAYALQWLAMGAVLAVLLIWHFRRRRATDV
jgi:surfeit locus 1 family protein